MATTFPTTIDNFTNPQASDKTDSPSHAGQHTDLNDAVEALQAKVGADSSAVATSHDYKLANLTVADITDLTATAAELNALDGITADVNELNILDGVTATAAELNITDGGSTAEKVLNTQPKFSVKPSGTQSVADSTATKVQHATEVFDVGSDFDNATNYRFVAPITGYYLFTASVGVTNLADGKQVISYLYVDGSVYCSGKAISASAGNDPIASTTDVIYLTAGQYVEHYMWHDHGGNISTTVGSEVPTRFSGHLLSV